MPKGRTLDPIVLGEMPQLPLNYLMVDECRSPVGNLPAFSFHQSREGVQKRSVRDASFSLQETLQMHHDHTLRFCPPMTNLYT